MKKFFTLIAAVAMAASMNAQTTYSLAGLTGDSFTYDESWFTYNNGKKQFNYLQGSSSELASLALKDTPVTFLYKNGSAKDKAFTISDTYFCAQSKNTQVSVSGLTAGQEVSFSVGSKGGTASVFTVLSGGEIVEMPTFAAKDGDNITFLTIKVKATEETVVIKETGGGFGIESVTVSDGTASGISNIGAASAAKSGKTFNLAGQQVSKSFKGLVIKNGKKYAK